ncbi:SPX domain-containing protein 3-like isoform X2 [Zingiber officinale]|uniref:SPX domain-containing protein 3-like isoform X2 n=1 Tax=Zingiber officinale TaxID=94328 RepID=UPI001C4D7CA3|nr:SPX domain-containing protein 3-like isoform X2 [Zingiber officinale]
MKFGKKLRRQMEDTLPQWRDKFLSYKDLKKLVSLISATQPPCSKAEAHFIHFLDAEIDKFNTFFVEMEEEFIIHQKERIKRVAEIYGVGGSQPLEEKYEAEMRKIRMEIVNFHGEMVLLVNYSSINYTVKLTSISGLAKILKKYDKRTGGLLRSPFIEKVLKQPFFTTDLISRLVKECENTMETLFPAVLDQYQTGEGGERTLIMAEQVFRNTVSALVTMKELRKGSSTYGHFSLPPLSLSLPDLDLLQSCMLPSPITIV